jgi:hypothetical protein
MNTQLLLLYQVCVVESQTQCPAVAIKSLELEITTEAEQEYNDVPLCQKTRPVVETWRPVAEISLRFLPLYEGIEPETLD